MNMIPVISQMGILFIIVAFGFIGAKSGIMKADTNELLSRVVLDITLPCSILYSVVGSEHSLSNAQILLLTGIAVVTAAALVLLAELLVKVFRIPAGQAGLCKFMIIFSNGAFIGFPVIRAVFGPDAIFYASAFNLAFMLLSYTYGVVLVRKKSTHFTWDILLTPIVLSSVAAYGIYLAHFQVPAFIVSTLQFIDPVTSPLSMLAIGCAMAALPMKNAFTAWRVHVALLVRMLFFPVAYYYFMGIFVHNHLILGVASIMVAMPAAASTTTFCAKYGNDQALASSGVFLTTLLSIGIIPLLCWILFS